MIITTSKILESKDIDERLKDESFVSSICDDKFQNYLLSSGITINPGETVDGIKNGQMDSSTHWTCQYEDALIQPRRLVLDIDMGKYASGKRNDR